MSAVTTLLAVLTAITVNTTNFVLRNDENITIWVGIQGGPGHAHLADGGLILESNEEVIIDAPDDWTGRVWARTWCDNETMRCETGDCGNGLECNGVGPEPPVSMLEVSLGGADGADVYGVSLDVGFNVPVSIEPIGGQSDGGQDRCKRAGCGYDINKDCPPELQLQTIHGVVGCKSPCTPSENDLGCCQGAQGIPDVCRPFQLVANMIYDNCPDASNNVNFTCSANTYMLNFGKGVL